jgi:hypothetical protein
MSAETAFLANVVLIVFVCLVGVGGFFYFRQHGCTLSEAAAFCLMAVLMIQAWIGQVLLMAGATSLYAIFLFLGALPGLKSALKIPRVFSTQLKAAANFARSYPLAVIGLLTVWGYTAMACAWPMIRLQGVVLENLNPLWRHSGSIFTFWRTSPAMALPVLNHVVFTAPWQPSLALAVANTGAYLAIGFSTYALARRYAWPPMAITVTLLVVSMTRLVHQSLTVDSELLPAAVSLTAILALYRSVERPQGQDLIMLVSTIAFSVSGGRLCYLMPAILVGLSLVLLGRRHGILLWGKNAAQRIGIIMGTVAVVVVFSQAAVVAANVAAGQEWIGATSWDRVVFNSDLPMGAIANLVRYFVLTIDLPDVIDRSCRWLFGFSPLASLKLFYHWTVTTTLDGQGAAAVFDWSWTAPYRLVWFGPVGFLLAIPSMFIAFWRGPHRLKSTALAILAYGMLIAMIVAWRPENVRLMTRFFVCGGFCMAFALPPWRLSRNGRLLLQLLGVLSMAHAILV